MSKFEARPAHGLQIEILGLGCIAVDDLLYVSKYPPTDSKIQVSHRQRRCGGLTAVALIAAAQLGARCAYGGALGDDELSRYCIRELERAGIALDWMFRVAAARPVHSTIVVDESDAARTIFYSTSGIVALPAGWPDRPELTGLKVLLVDHFSVEAQTRAATLARENGIAVVADLERDDVAGFEKLLNLCDHLILSWDFCRRLTGCEDPQRAIAALWQTDRATVAVTCGRDGAFFVTRGANGCSTPVQHMKAYKVDAVDTTGCGDVFHGAYAAGLASGRDIVESLRTASAAAALKATADYQHQEVLTMKKVLAFVEENE